MSPKRSGGRGESTEPLPGTPSLSLGYLAALPLFLAYELGLLLEHGATARAAAERVVSRVLLLGEWILHEPPAWARTALLLAVAVAALVRLARTGPLEVPLPRLLARTAAEGLLVGILLGPTLTLLQGWLASEPLAARLPPPRSLAASLRLIGAAPWEELLFRVGLYGAVFLAVRQVASFLGLQTRPARFGAELVALLGSALLFAWFHLDAAQRLLGASGEPFHRGLFLWRLSAGICLGGLFRWRGFGVASWAHAVFNLGIALGIRP